MRLDAIDKRLLAALQKEGRITNSELAERINLSPSACHRRVQRLEAEGYISGFVALLDARKLGRPTTVFVEITLAGQADELLDAFERAVTLVPDILEARGRPSRHLLIALDGQTIVDDLARPIARGQTLVFISAQARG